MNAEKKYQKLQRILGEYEDPVIAFSGGVDSTFLTAAARDAGLEFTAVTVKTPFVPSQELIQTQELAQKLEIVHHIITMDLSALGEALANTPERCYYCKNKIFAKIKEYAGNRVVIEGSNQDDTRDYRPGRKALAELGIKSPLLKAGLTKQEIRHLSREMELSTWDKPSLPCLATRVSYNSEITLEKLRKIEKAEKILAELGLKQYRVRDHNNLARIEVLPEEREKLFTPELLDQLDNKFKQIGFDFVTLDLAGYKSGSMNNMLEEDTE